MLLAVHLSDGVLTVPWLVAGWVVAAGLVALACWRLDERDVPRLGVLTAAFFVGSQIHLPAGGVSVHLLLNGLVGVILGRRAGLAVAVGLFLQALLFAHGGFTTLGMNISIYALPAILAGAACGPLRRSGLVRVPAIRFAFMFGAAAVWLASAVVAVQWVGAKVLPDWTAGDWWLARPAVIGVVLLVAAVAAWLERRLEADPEFAVGALLGGATAYLTVGLNCFVLAFGGTREVRSLAGVVLLQLPVVLVESVGVGFVVAYLAKAKPEWIGGAVGQPSSDSGKTSSSGTSH
jgi:ABC-type Co2+ transport system permease subunit